MLMLRECASMPVIWRVCQYASAKNKGQCASGGGPSRPRRVEETATTRPRPSTTSTPASTTTLALATHHGRVEELLVASRVLGAVGVALVGAAVRGRAAGGAGRVLHAALLRVGGCLQRRGHGIHLRRESATRGGARRGRHGEEEWTRRCEQGLERMDDVRACSAADPTHGDGVAGNADCRHGREGAAAAEEESGGVGWPDGKRSGGFVATEE